jgi:N-acetylneuraminic acid mutarotase
MNPIRWDCQGFLYLGAALLGWTLLCAGGPALQSAQAEGELQWAWVKGDSRIKPPGVYGTQGTPDPVNNPGRRNGAVSWTDSAGTFWLFGGAGLDASGGEGFLNDLWKFDPLSGNWTWIKGSSVHSRAGVHGELGVAHPDNTPGARGWATSWTDAQGRLWLFGGQGYDGNSVIGRLNDQWVFDPATGNWTWVGGSSESNKLGVYGTRTVPAAENMPGGRYRAASCTDTSGTLWLFGGHGYATGTKAGYLSDLWKYDLATGYWTWMKGDKYTNGPGAYGTLGVAEPDNLPGARSGLLLRADAHNVLWLFGGNGYGSGYADTGQLNDLWKYDPATGYWGWFKGSQSVSRFMTPIVGVYGHQGIPHDDNTPGARELAVAWMDSAGAIWLHGGTGADAGGVINNLSDLWKLDPATLQWTWMDGPTTHSQPGNYGPLGVPGPDNRPGARNSAVSWTASTTEGLWLFSGKGRDAAGVEGDLNDLWRYNPATGQWTWMKGRFSIHNAGNYGTRGVAHPDNQPGPRQNAAYSADTSGTLWLFGGRGRDSLGKEGNLNDLWKFDSAAGLWTWVEGGTLVNQVGYLDSPPTTGSLSSGRIRLNQQNNTPGSNSGAAMCHDGQGNLYVFGGSGNSMFVNGTGVLGDLWMYNGQTGMWSILAGRYDPDLAPIYPSGVGPSYCDPGGLVNAAMWFDKEGNLILFGGFGFDEQGNWGQMDNVWKFDMKGRHWEWVSGSKKVSTSANPIAGSYGDLGVPSPTNHPGPRSGASNTITPDEDEHWLFGGEGYDGEGNYGLLGDLWTLDFNNGYWIWMDGSLFGDDFPEHGVIVDPDPKNKPGSRTDAPILVRVIIPPPLPPSPYNPYSRTKTGGLNNAAKDPYELWLFGGFGFDSTGNPRRLNDLWKYNPKTKLWTWMQGDKVGNQPGRYGTRGETAPDNTPGARRLTVAWTDAVGNIWLFGGHGYDENGELGFLNDLWRIDPGTAPPPEELSNVWIVE